MSSKFNVNDNVKELVSEIISKNNWGPVTEVKYYPGTEAGDGYASEHVGVDIINEKGTIRLFIKCAITTPSSADIFIETYFTNESYFYNMVYPAYKKFLEEKRIKNCFRNAPKYYGTSKRYVIVLENLKDKGFTLFDRKQAMNDSHISLVLKTFAKFHAVSYAFKDQDTVSYEKLAANVSNEIIVQPIGNDSPSIRIMRDMLKDGLNKLDPMEDKRLLEKCNMDDLLSIIVDAKHYLNEYSIITQGDCWCNNIMFLYEETNKQVPVDVVLVDWQLLRKASPVFDISYFFYTIANEEALSKLNFYLKEYYTELSSQIKNLGSDPDKLYPFTVFEKEWKLYCKYGFAMAFILFKFMLVTKDEVPRFEGKDLEQSKTNETTNYFTKFSNDAEYTRRIRVLGEFMMKNKYL